MITNGAISSYNSMRKTIRIFQTMKDYKINHNLSRLGKEKLINKPVIFRIHGGLLYKKFNLRSYKSGK